MGIYRGREGRSPTNAFVQDHVKVGIFIPDLVKDLLNHQILLPAFLKECPGLVLVGELRSELIGSDFVVGLLFLEE